VAKQDCRRRDDSGGKPRQSRIHRVLNRRAVPVGGLHGAAPDKKFRTLIAVLRLSKLQANS
jgi:hypothetical protein